MKGCLLTRSTTQMWLSTLNALHRNNNRYTEGSHCEYCHSVIIERQVIPVLEQVGYTVRYYTQCYAEPQASETFDECSQRISQQYGYSTSYIRSMTDDFGNTYYLYYKPADSENKTGLIGDTPSISALVNVNKRASRTATSSAPGAIPRHLPPTAALL